MFACWCSLAGTAACKHCYNNPNATEVWTNTNATTNTIAIPMDDLPKVLDKETLKLVFCKDCEYYIKHDKRCAVWNHGVHKDDYCSRGLKKEVEDG